VAILLSAYHGNSDAAIAFFLLLAVGCAAQSRALRAGVALGASTWIKLPGLLALPALALSFSRTRDRIRCAAAALATGVVGYLPSLVSDPLTLYQRVFAYRGQVIHSTTGVPIWGPLALLAPFFDLPGVKEAARAWFEHDTLVIALPILALAWLRRGERTVEGIGATVARCYGAVYGLSMRFAFQYFAWSVPLWWLAGRRFFAGATLFAGAWLYGLYAWLCGDPWLRGSWDFVGHPVWPTWLLLLRDAGVIFFLAATAGELVAASRSARHRDRDGSVL